MARLSRRRLLLAGAGAACALPLAGLARGADAAGGTRMLTASDVHVANYPTVEAVRWIGQTLRETLESDLAAEHDARTLYLEAREYCSSVNDQVSKSLFDDLIEDEEGHIDFLETQFDLIKAMGLQNYIHLQSKPAEE